MQFYRYNIRSFEYETVKLQLDVYDLYKETPCGYWINVYSCPLGKKWIPKKSIRRWAYPTKKEALNSCLKRTQTRINILKSDLDMCREGLGMIKNELTHV